jgi:competence protein ComGC
MKDSDIRNILKTFQQLQPTEEFSGRLKQKLEALHTIKQLPVAKLMNVRPAESAYAFTIASRLRRLSPFPQSANAFVFAVASVLVLVGVYTITKELSPFFLPGLNQRGISAEADMVQTQINIQLSQLEYFQTTSQNSAAALKEVTEPGLDHLNEALIQNESQAVEKSPEAAEIPERNKDINSQLEQMLEEVSR